MNINIPPKYGWSLIKTNKIKPFGYKGYMFTLYSLEDDISIIKEINAKTEKVIEKRIRLYFEKIKGIT